jgi:hypothetical protein
MRRSLSRSANGRRLARFFIIMEHHGAIAASGDEGGARRRGAGRPQPGCSQPSQPATPDGGSIRLRFRSSFECRPWVRGFFVFLKGVAAWLVGNCKFKLLWHRHIVAHGSPDDDSAPGFTMCGILGKASCREHNVPAYANVA